MAWFDAAGHAGTIRFIISFGLFWNSVAVTRPPECVIISLSSSRWEDQMTDFTSEWLMSRLLKIKQTRACVSELHLVNPILWSRECKLVRDSFDVFVTKRCGTPDFFKSATERIQAITSLIEHVPFERKKVIWNTNIPKLQPNSGKFCYLGIYMILE